MGDVKDKGKKSRRAANDSFELSKYAERLLENINDLVQSIGTDGKFVYVNRKWRETLGYSLREAQGLSFESILRRDQIEHCNQIFQGLLTGEKYENIETVFVTKKGEEIYVEGNVNTVVEDGKVEVTIGVFHDITGRKKVEEMLRESGEHFRQMVDLLPEAVCEFDASGNILFSNHAAFIMVGYDEADFKKGLNILPMIAPEDQKRAFTNIQKMMAGEALGADEYTLVRKDGSRFPATVHIANILNASGKTIGFRGIIVDITERRQAAEAQQRLAAIVESSHDAIIGKTLDGIITSWNKGAEERYGYSAEEVIGHHISIIVPPDRADEVPRFLETIGQGGAVIDYETVRVAKDGRRIIALVTISPIRDASGRVVGASTIAQDVTERKRAEEALKRSTQLLKDTGAIAKVGGWELSLATQEQVWTEEVYRIHEVDMAYKPTLSGGIDFYTPTSRPIIERAVQRAIEYGEPFDVELEIITAKGNLRWVHAVGKIDQEQGKVLGTFQDITEPKRMQEALRESEERYRSLYADSRDAVMILSPDEGFLAGNPAAIEVFGCRDEQDFIARAPALLSPEYQPDGARSVDKAQEMMRLALEKGFNFFEWMHRRADGADFLATVLLSRLGNGDKRLLQATVRDITESKRAQEALRESEAKYRQLIETLQEGVWVIDKDANTTFVNPRMAEMLGYTVEEMLGKSLFGFMDERDVEIAKYNMERRKQGIVEQHDFEFLRKDGRRIYATLETSPLTDEKGDFIGALAGVIDITEHKQLETLLKESEQKFREMADFLPQSIFEIDLEGHFTYANRYGFESTGYTLEDIRKGMHIIELFIPEQRDRIAKNTLAVLSGQKFDDHEYGILRKDGSTFPALIYTNVIMRDGKPAGIRGIVLDITERKKIEQMKTDFVSFISHQLRTPVAGLMAYIDNMLEGITGALNNMQVDYLWEMRGVCARNNQLIADLLNISRLERGVLAVNINPVDLRSVVDLAVKEHRKAIEEKGLALNIKEAEQGIVVLADSDKLIEVLKNVIHNATKFTRTGSINIEMMTDGDRGIIKVRDTGVGMTEEALMNLFRKEKVMSGAIAAGGGAGLGLYIAKGFMQLQHGDITAESIVGKGSTFIISLPRE